MTPTMTKITRDSLMTLEAYAKARKEFRARVIEHKKARSVALGEHLTLLFEDELTIRYQIQEMLRAERIQKEPEIAHEIETYNELIGGKGELGCSLLIEITDPAERDAKLRQWTALPKHLYVKTEDGEKHRARYDERQVGEDRLSSVQYLRFDVKGRQPIAIGTDLPGFTTETALDGEQREALRADLASDAS